jgi:hypothetical protein
MLIKHPRFSSFLQTEAAKFSAGGHFFSLNRQLMVLRLVNIFFIGLLPSGLKEIFQ